MSSATKWLLLGLQGTGKTTYLAALWHQLESSELQTAVVADSLQPDRTYLNSIRDAWLSLREVPRTSLRAEQSVQLLLRSCGERIEVTFPDPSGEGLAGIWSSRAAPKAFVSQARESTGILLFLHPKRIREGARISPGTARNEEAQFEVQWKPEIVPTQVQLIDLLQLTIALREDAPTTLSVVVSAWDLIDNQVSPEDWVRSGLPMLWQFLAASNVLQVRYFGVSAIGGDLESEKDRLSTVRLAAERVAVRSTMSEAGRDLTIPLQHLLSHIGM